MNIKLGNRADHKTQELSQSHGPSAILWEGIEKSNSVTGHILISIQLGSTESNTNHLEGIKKQ